MSRRPLVDPASEARLAHVLDVGLRFGNPPPLRKKRDINHVSVCEIGAPSVQSVLDKVTGADAKKARRAKLAKAADDVNLVKVNLDDYNAQQTAVTMETIQMLNQTKRGIEEKHVDIIALITSANEQIDSLAARAESGDTSVSQKLSELQAQNEIHYRDLQESLESSKGELVAEFTARVADTIRQTITQVIQESSPGIADTISARLIELQREELTLLRRAIGWSNPDQYASQLRVNTLQFNADKVEQLLQFGADAYARPNTKYPDGIPPAIGLPLLDFYNTKTVPTQARYDIIDALHYHGFTFHKWTETLPGPDGGKYVGIPNLILRNGTMDSAPSTLQFPGNLDPLAFSPDALSYAFGKIITNDPLKHKAFGYMDYRTGMDGGFNFLDFMLEKYVQKWFDRKLSGGFFVRYRQRQYHSSPRQKELELKKEMELERKRQPYDDADRQHMIDVVDALTNAGAMRFGYVADWTSGRLQVYKDDPAFSSLDVSDIIEFVNSIPRVGA